MTVLDERRELIKKYINYLIFGGLTTVVSVAVYYFFIRINVYYVIANVISFVVSVAFAFYVNKYFVFKKMSDHIKEVFNEMVKFFTARIGSFFLDFFSLIFMVDFLNMDKMVSKIIISVIIIILNYLISEYIVFKKV